MNFAGPTTYDAKQQSIGGSVTAGVGFSASVSYSNSKAKGDFASVTEQTGIQAGGGGFQLNVKGNTDLKGAVIASTQEAIDAKLNRLSTGTLTHSDIENHSDHEASAVSLSGGFSVAGKAGDSKGSEGESGNSGMKLYDPSKTGITGAGIGASSDSGSESSTTRSSISLAEITIADETSQKALTGQTAEQTIASINRDVLAGDDANGLAKTWDGQKLMHEQAVNAQIMASFGQQAALAIGNAFTAKVNDLKQQAKLATGAEQDALLAEAKKWDEGGVYRIAAHAAAGALGGGATGALGAAGSAAAAPLLNGLQDKIAKNLNEAGLSFDAAEMVGQLVTGAAATGIGAVASGGSAVGAATAMNADFHNRQLHKKEISRIKDLAKGNAEKEARLTAAACALAKCYAEYPEDSLAYQQFKSMADIGDSAAFTAERELLQQQQGMFSYGVFDEYHDAAKKINNNYQVTTRALGAGQAGLGALGLGATGALCTTGVGCAASAVTVTLSADALYTGSKQLISGQSEATLFNHALQSLGMSEEAAGYAEFLFGVGAAAKVGAVVNAAANHTAKLNNLARASHSKFSPNGIEPTPEVMKSQQVQAMFKELRAGAPTLADEKMVTYVRQWVESGSTMPSMATAAPGSMLIKVVPKGEGVTAHSAYWMSVEQGRTIATMTPEQAGKSLGLPAKQAWQMLNGGVDYYAMTAKPGAMPKVFVSDVAETLQGNVNNLANTKQIIVPNRSLWTEPKVINPMTLR